MADISKCYGLQEIEGYGEVCCPIREYCYRHNAPVNIYRQSWFSGLPIDSVDGRKGYTHFNSNTVDRIKTGTCTYYGADPEKPLPAKLRARIAVSIQHDEGN